jgi:hypothetical protein
VKKTLAVVLLSLALVDPASAEVDENQVRFEVFIGMVAINLFFSSAALLASVGWGAQWWVWRTAPSQPSDSPAAEQ